MVQVVQMDVVGMALRGVDDLREMEPHDILLLRADYRLLLEELAVLDVVLLTVVRADLDEVEVLSIAIMDPEVEVEDIPEVEVEVDPLRVEVEVPIMLEPTRPIQ